jgi:hypothetical protein
MSDVRRRRVRRRRKLVRGVKRTFINVVFAPMRMPKMKQESVDLVTRLCEIAALTFVALLVAHIAMPQLIGTAVVVIAGIAFAVLCGLIKLSDYREKIERYRYYGFRI